MAELSHNNQKKIAVINDISGFGRCSITVALPIISHLKLQCCPLPTAILSNHTGYAHYFFDDYTPHMRSYMESWRELGLTFDGIATGFLGSGEQIRIVEEFIQEFRTPQTKVIVDPVMGDDGVLYPTYSRDMQREMRKLVSAADILTPNLTEACFLTETEWKPEHWTQKELFALTEKLAAYGADKIVISGIRMGGFLGNVIYEACGTRKILRKKRVGRERAGTGDVFAAIIAADSVNQVAFPQSVRHAADFIQTCMERTERRRIPAEDGVCFEELLGKL